MELLKYSSQASTSSLFTLLSTCANPTLIHARYPQPLLPHLLERLQTLTLDGASGAVIVSGFTLPASAPSPAEGVPPVYQLTFPLEPPPHPEAIFCVLGTASSIVVCGQRVLAEQADPDTQMIDLCWSVDPAVVTCALDWIEPMLAHHAPDQHATFQQVRRDFPPLPASPDRLLHLSADLLGFVANQHSTLVTANRELAARLSWQEDQTRMMVHDIRAPLHALLVSLKNLLPQQLDPAGQRELLLIAYDSAHLLETLIETTMDALRLEAGKMPLKYQPLQVSTLIQAVCEPFNMAGRAEHARLCWSCPDDLPVLWGDRGLLERVLTNLLSNAIKFTPADGEIIVSARLTANAEALEMIVGDTGVGIALEAQPHIFQRFYQANSKDGRRGFGLGLYFCRVAVEAHGGQISFTSTPGVGSIFKVVLPLNPPAHADVGERDP